MHFVVCVSVCVFRKRRKEEKEEMKKAETSKTVVLKNFTPKPILNHVNKKDLNSKNEASGELKVLNTSKN